MPKIEILKDANALKVFTMQQHTGHGNVFNVIYPFISNWSKVKSCILTVRAHIRWLNLGASYWGSGETRHIFDDHLQTCQSRRKTVQKSFFIVLLANHSSKEETVTMHKYRVWRQLPVYFLSSYYRKEATYRN